MVLADRRHETAFFVLPPGVSLVEHVDRAAEVVQPLSDTVHAPRLRSRPRTPTWYSRHLLGRQEVLLQLQTRKARFRVLADADLLALG